MSSSTASPLSLSSSCVEFLCGDDVESASDWGLVASFFGVLPPFRRCFDAVPPLCLAFGGVLLPGDFFLDAGLLFDAGSYPGNSWTVMKLLNLELLLSGRR